MNKRKARGSADTYFYDLFISPAITKAGWDPITQIRRESPHTPRLLIVPGTLTYSITKTRKRTGTSQRTEC